MRGKSHICLGEYLSQRYLSELPRVYVRAFLLGCIQPDRNPATYLKGSLGCQWLRGHNYPNSLPYILRIGRRLERRQVWNLFDYYTLGKLIHYAADAFTWAHNPAFPETLACHRAYEEALQTYFLEYLAKNHPVERTHSGSVADCFTGFHEAYRSAPAGVFRDSRFALQASCCILVLLLQPVFVPQ